MKSPRTIVLLCVFIAILAVWAPLWHIGRREDEANKALEIAQDRHTWSVFHPLYYESVKAYRQIGADPGGWSPYGSGLKWGEREPTLPGFKFAAFPHGEFPDVPIPFGLKFQQTAVTDADLRKLTHLKTLVRIEFDENTKVTVTGLAELLKALPKCEILRLSPQ